MASATLVEYLALYHSSGFVTFRWICTNIHISAAKYFSFLTANNRQQKIYMNPILEAARPILN